MMITLNFEQDHVLTHIEYTKYITYTKQRLIFKLTKEIRNEDH